MRPPDARSEEIPLDAIESIKFDRQRGMMVIRRILPVPVHDFVPGDESFQEFWSQNYFLFGGLAIAWASTKGTKTDNIKGVDLNPMLSDLDRIRLEAEVVERLKAVITVYDPERIRKQVAEQTRDIENRLSTPRGWSGSYLIYFSEEVLPQARSSQ